MSFSSNSPRVSIIMNCFNGEKFLHQSLDSIIQQTYKNWELIFWDVSTSDKSKKILEEYKEKRFKYFNIGVKKNLYNSRNEAIEVSNGELIAFLDCDDWWHKEKLEKQIKLFEDESVAMVYSGYFEYHQHKNKFKKISTSKIFSGYIQSKIIHDYHIGILTTLIRKKVFHEIRGYNNFFHICGDFEFNIRMSENNKIIGLKEFLAYYRIHKENISRDIDKEIIELEYCYEIFKKKGLKNLKKFENFLNYRKFKNSLKKNNRKIALEMFLKLDFGFLKFKALILFCLGSLIR
ncbi:glycosyltransferase [Candidatus Pelagibacter bacterium]|nr:glycosyltransferase [Candidatus Pelagibacter bacterium]